MKILKVEAASKANPPAAEFLRGGFIGTIVITIIFNIIITMIFNIIIICYSSIPHQAGCYLPWLSPSVSQRTASSSGS